MYTRAIHTGERIPYKANKNWVVVHIIQLQIFQVFNYCTIRM